jgi:predicted P-loop ATPase
MTKDKFINRQFDIAIADRCNTTNWENVTYGWGEFIDRLEQKEIIPDPPYKLDETDADYEKRLNKLKDKGGYFPGKLNSNRKKNSSVEYKSMVALDADFADDEILAKIRNYDFVYALHTTFKHKPEKPRYRIVIPLARDYSASDCAKLTRALMQEFGIEKFDTGSADESRMMFWPVVLESRVDYFHFEAPPKENYIDADEWIKRYDPAKWVGVDKKVTRQTKTGGEAKAGRVEIVGLVDKAFTPQQVMDTFLSDVYEKTSDPDRYLLKGSVSGAGVAILPPNEKGYRLIYSHHTATDLPEMKIGVSPFDAVRVRKYGKFDDKLPRDENGEITTPMSERKSFIKAEKFFRDRPEIKAVINEFGKELTPVVVPSVEELDIEKNLELAVIGNRSGIEAMNASIDHELVVEKVISGMDVSLTTGSPVDTIESYEYILENDPMFAGKFRENLLSETYEFAKRPRWDKYTKAGADYEEVPHFSIIKAYIQKYYGIKNKEQLTDALNIVFRKHAYHVLLDFLFPMMQPVNILSAIFKELPDDTLDGESWNPVFKEASERTDDENLLLSQMQTDKQGNPITTIWDGVERLETIIIDILGAKDTPLTRQETRKWFIGAVNRALYPGTPMDNMLVLMGDNEVGKTYFCGAIAGQKKGCLPPALYQSFDAQEFTSKDVLESLRGSWVVEMEELTSLQVRFSSTNSLKQFLTKKVDKYRTAYAKKPRIHPRQFVLIGTTNDPSFLRQHDRRYWPIEVGVDWSNSKHNGESVAERMELIQGENRRQVFAEALHYLLLGETPMLPPEYAQEAKDEADKYLISNDIYNEVNIYLNAPLCAPNNNEWYSYTSYDTKRERIRIYLHDETDNYGPKSRCIRTKVAFKFIREEIPFDSPILDPRNKQKIENFFRDSKFWEVHARDKGYFGKIAKTTMPWFERKDQVEIDGQYFDRATKLSDFVGFYL